MKIVSYNVNGIRSAIKKGLMDWLAEQDADIVCLQEVRISKEQMDTAPFEALGYHVTLNSAERKGYSGVAVLSKQIPDYTSFGIGIESFDQEGRSIRVDFGDLTCVCVYHPSGSSGIERTNYKMDFHNAWQAYLEEVRKHRPRLVVCGDFNMAHQPIDIHAPIRAAKFSGFLTEEREWLTQFIALGYTDVWRHLHPQEIAYSWWSPRAGSRERNKGWRIDYCFLSPMLLPHLLEAELHDNAHHSDHCPLIIRLNRL